MTSPKRLCSNPKSLRIHQLKDKGTLRLQIEFSLQSANFTYKREVTLDFPNGPKVIIP